MAKAIGGKLARTSHPKNGRGRRTTTRHLSWSVNIFHDFIHTFIHSFGGLWSGGSLGVVGTASLDEKDSEWLTPSVILQSGPSPDADGGKLAPDRTGESIELARKAAQVATWKRPGEHSLNSEAG